MLGICISNFYLIALLHNMAVFEHEILRIAVANSGVVNAEQMENVIIDHLLTDKLAQVSENMDCGSQTNYSRISCLKIVHLLCQSANKSFAKFSLIINDL